MNDWIPVSYAVPDDNVNVIIDGGIGYIRQGVWMTVTGERFPGKSIQWDVTHWQPIPILDSAQTRRDTIQGLEIPECLSCGAMSRDECTCDSADSRQHHCADHSWYADRPCIHCFPPVEQAQT